MIIPRERGEKNKLNINRYFINEDEGVFFSFEHHFIFPPGKSSLQSKKKSHDEYKEQKRRRRKILIYAWSNTSYSIDENKISLVNDGGSYF